MSSPIDDNGANDRLMYAPRWARQQFADDDTARTPAAPYTPSTEPAPDAEPWPPESYDDAHDLDPPTAPTLETAGLPEMASRVEIPADSWTHASGRTFEGDRAVREMRMRMSLDPHALPEPPELKSSGSGWKLAFRTFVFTALAAGTAFVVMLYAYPEAKRATSVPHETTKPASAKKTYRVPAMEARRPDPGRLVLIERRQAVMNEAVPLDITLAGGSGQGVVLIGGLATGTQVSAGLPIESGTWRVPVGDLARASVIPPDGFVGIMHVTVALLADDTQVTDKSAMQIEWTKPSRGTAISASATPEHQPATLPFPATALSSPAPAAPSPAQILPSPAPALPSPAPAVPSPSPALQSPAPQSQSSTLQLEPGEIESLVKRGRDFIANGDLAAARLVLRRAANGGNAQAALLLGTTFDPATFEKLRVIGAAPDPAEARDWYHRAIELGSDEAERRLAPLESGAH